MKSRRDDETRKLDLGHVGPMFEGIFVSSQSDHPPLEGVEKLAIIPRNI
jgi:hypothetical protein